jgi:hypothetical protein
MNIDDALREYVSQPVPLGLEARVMRRVGANSRRPRWGWAVPVLVAAGALAMSVWMRPMPRQTPAAVQPRSFAGAAVESAQVRPARVTAVRVAPVKQRHRRLSGVQALWRFAQAHPEEAVKLTVAYEPAPIVPLRIEPISIEEVTKIEESGK